MAKRFLVLIAQLFLGATNAVFDTIDKVTDTVCQSSSNCRQKGS